MADPLTIKIGSYNVLRGERGTPQQFKEALSPFDFDLLALCESPKGEWLEQVGQELNLPHKFAGDISTAGHVDKYKVVLSKTPFIKQEELFIQGSRWGAHCSTVRVATNINGINIAVYSLHIPKSSDPDVTGVHFMANEMIPNERAALSIYAGDFNTRIGSPTLAVLESAGLRNPWLDLGLDYKNLRSMEQPADNNPAGGVIDHILYKSEYTIKVTNGGLIELNPMLSDHKPVWVEFEITRNH